MVEVVIRLPKEELDKVRDCVMWGLCDTALTVDIVYRSLANGIVLPKGHGRLIDADAINIHDVSPAYGMEVYGVTQDDIEYEPTIIEADKEVEE